MSDAHAPAAPVVELRGDSEEWTQRPVLVFFTRRTSGPARRMASLIAWIKVTRRKRLRVVEVDADDNPELARRLHVSQVPALVLVKRRRVVGRLEGRATGHDIEQMIRPHLS
jgi:thioredoxin